MERWLCLLAAYQDARQYDGQVTVFDSTGALLTTKGGMIGDAAGAGEVSLI
jgi:hypothetical protein